MADAQSRIAKRMAEEALRRAQEAANAKAAAAKEKKRKEEQEAKEKRAAAAAAKEAAQLVIEAKQNAEKKAVWLAREAREATNKRFEAKAAAAKKAAAAIALTKIDVKMTKKVMKKMAKRVIKHLFTYVIEHKKGVTAEVFRAETIKTIVSLKKRHSKDMNEAFAALNTYFGNDFYAPLCRTLVGQISTNGIAPQTCPNDKILLKMLNEVIAQQLKEALISLRVPVMVAYTVTSQWTMQ